MKGDNFTIPNLLNVSADSETAQYFDDGSLAIFRLAPADYHRFHSPVNGTVRGVVGLYGVPGYTDIVCRSQGMRGTRGKRSGDKCPNEGGAYLGRRCFSLRDGVVRVAGSELSELQSGER